MSHSSIWHVHVNCYIPAWNLGFLKPENYLQSENVHLEEISTKVEISQLMWGTFKSEVNICVAAVFDKILRVQKSEQSILELSFLILINLFLSAMKVQSQ